MTLDIQFLDARQGDAIWIRWGAAHQIMIDMGTHQTGVALVDRIRALPKEQRHFDLLVVTHVDVDHIGGVLSCVSEPVDGLVFDDVWFNGWEHLSGGRPASQGVTLEPMGGGQGEAFATWLRTQRWNEAFHGGPVIRAGLPPVDMGDGLTLTVIAPSQARLEALKPDWAEDVRAAIDRGRLNEVSPGLEVMGPSTPPILEGKADLSVLAEKSAPKDRSTANGSSIALLLEWQGRRVLLTGDGFADELCTGLAEVDDGRTVALDLIKAPHHGSRQNMTKALVQAVDCPLWVFSSDGTTFRHPDAQAIARILEYGSHANPTFAFNVPSIYNSWWNDDAWRALFGYQVSYGTVGDGLTVSLTPA